MAEITPMDGTTLRTLQAPLKDQYRQDPSSALLTLHASGTLASSSISCSLASGPAIADAKAKVKVAGLHPAAGGSDPEVSGELCSGDMLLEALVACAGVTLKAVATAMDIELRSGVVTAEGDLDFRGTLGVDRAAPVGFVEIRLAFELDTDANEETVGKLVKLTERYCVVLQTITKGPNIVVKATRATDNK